MSIRYLNILLIICMIVSYGFMCSGCKNIKKNAEIIIKHESKLSKLKQQKNSNGMIDLSDGRKVNFNAPIGPNDISEPNFNVINVGLH